MRYVNKIFAVLVSISIFSTLLVADVTKNKKSQYNTLSIADTTVIDYNNLVIQLNNNGFFADYSARGNASINIRNNNINSFDTGVQSIFQLAPWFSAYKNGTLVGAFPDYSKDMGPGSYGSDINDTAFRIYKVNVEMFNSPENFDDFQNWPIDQGAPWVDVDGDGEYNPLPSGVDHPKFYGDIVAFFVSADDEPGDKLAMNPATDPTEVEFQTTVFAFNSPSFSDYHDVVFYRTLLINKGTETLTDAYFGVFADPDLGVNNNDFMGTSVEQDFAYVYNGEDDDSEIVDYFGNGFDGAVGIQLLQGPLVDCSADGNVNITLLATDDDSNDTLTYYISQNPQNGSISLSGNIATYTPNSGFSGDDSFQYYVSDGTDDSNIATVNIVVYDQGQTNLPTIAYPNGGEDWVMGQTYEIAWSNGFTNTGIELFKGNTEVLDISGDEGNASSFSWTIPTNLTPGNDYRVRIYDAGPGNDGDFSDNFFSISDTGKIQKYEYVEDLNTLFFEKANEVISHGHNHDYSNSRTPEGFIRCSTDELEAHLQVINPEYIKKRDEFLEQIKINASQRSLNQSTTITIPIVFHVLYYNQSDNLSKDYIAANFDQINLDFKNTNPDGAKVPSSANPADAPNDPSIDYSHASERGTHDIQFVGVNGETLGSDLQEDTSIIRYNINRAQVSDLSDAAQLVNSTTADNGAQGGFKNGYMNIYIAPLGSGLLGQATLGGTTHCVVLTGSVGSVDFPGSTVPFNLGRTLTH